MTLKEKLKWKKYTLKTLRQRKRKLDLDDPMARAEKREIDNGILEEKAEILSLNICINTTKALKKAVKNISDGILQEYLKQVKEFYKNT